MIDVDAHIRLQEASFARSDSPEDPKPPGAQVAPLLRDRGIGTGGTHLPGSAGSSGAANPGR